MPDRVTLPPLELATFVADDVVRGGCERLGGRAAASRPRLVRGRGRGPALASVQIEVVRPGDPVRIANVLDAVLPDVKADEPEQTFPERWGLALAGAAAPTAWRAWRLSVCDWLAAVHDRTSSRTRSSTWPGRAPR